MNHVIIANHKFNNRPQATLTKGHPSYQAIFQMQLDSKILLNCPSLEWPLFHCRRGRLPYKRGTTVLQKN